MAPTENDNVHTKHVVQHFRTRPQTCHAWLTTTTRSREHHRCARTPMRHCATATSVGIAPQHLTDLEHVQCAKLRRAESCSARPCGHGIPALWWTSQCAQHLPLHLPHCGLVVSKPSTTCMRPRHKTQKPDAPSQQQQSRQVSEDALAFPHPTQRAQPKLPRVHWMPRSTVSSDAPAARNMQLTSLLGASWPARTNQMRCHPLGKNTVRVFHIILTSLHCLPLVRGGKREHVRFSTGL